MNKDTLILIEALGWNKRTYANWSYRYYRVLVVSNDLELLPFSGIYADQFGSVENALNAIERIYRNKESKFGYIRTYTMSDVKLPLRDMQKICHSHKPNLDELVKLLEIPTA